MIVATFFNDASLKKKKKNRTQEAIHEVLDTKYI